MRIIRKLFNIWSVYWFTAGLILGAIIHLITILSLPYLSEHKAWDRLGTAYSLNAMTVLPPVTPASQPLPFMAPDIRYAVCRYDVRTRPLQVRANLLNEMWSVAVFNRRGENVYTLSGDNLRSRDVDIKISLAENDVLNLGFRPNAIVEQGIPVKVHDPEGLVMVRAPLISAAYTEQAATNLAVSTCKSVRR